MRRIKRIIAPAYISLAILTLMACVTSETLVGDVTRDTISKHNGYTYEFWSQNGTGQGVMNLNEGATFDIQWKNIENLLARLGVRPGTPDLKVHYSVDYKPDGNSYMCVYGWTQSNLIEYYIVDNWGSWRPPGGGYVTTVTIDGAEYDLFETTRTNQPSIEGTKTFQQYWSVRKERRSSGTIDIKKHFDAWEANGMKMGSRLYEVSFCIEGYKSSGFADVTHLNFERNN